MNDKTATLHDDLRHSPACDRNRGPLLAQLQRVLPARGLLLVWGRESAV